MIELCCETVSPTYFVLLGNLPLKYFLCLFTETKCFGQFAFNSLKYIFYENLLEVFDLLKYHRRGMEGGNDPIYIRKVKHDIFTIRISGVIIRISRVLQVCQISKNYDQLNNVCAEQGTNFKQLLNQNLEYFPAKYSLLTKT